MIASPWLQNYTNPVSVLHAQSCKQHIYILIQNKYIHAYVWIKEHVWQ